MPERKSLMAAEFKGRVKKIVNHLLVCRCLSGRLHSSLRRGCDHDPEWSCFMKARPFGKSYFMGKNISVGRTFLRSIEAIEKWSVKGQCKLTEVRPRDGRRVESVSDCSEKRSVLTCKSPHKIYPTHAYKWSSFKFASFSQMLTGINTSCWHTHQAWIH